MTDITNLTTSTMDLGNNIIEHEHQNRALSGGYSVRNHLNMKLQTNTIQHSNHITLLNLQRNVLQNNINCVKDLNLVLTNISQMKSEITNKIINHINRINNNHIKQLNNSSKDNQNKNDSDDNNDEAVIIDQYIILMLVRINSYLIENLISQSYKIIVFYQFHNTNTAQYKQLICMVPYANSYPLDGISEITLYNTCGKDRKIDILTKLLNGGFGYTKDWLGLYVQEDMLEQYIQKINVSYSNRIFRGFTINYNIDLQIACRQSRFILHVPGFSGFWDNT